MAGLRDRLRAALAETPAEGEPTAAELSERIQALRSAHTVEATPARVCETPRSARVREPLPSAPTPDVSVDPPPESKPEDETPGEGGASTETFRAQVRKSVQGRLF